MTNPSRQRRASRVQFPGRPSGAPSELDAAESLCEARSRGKHPISHPQSQARKYNLNSAISGPTFGDHFNYRLRYRVENFFQRLKRFRAVGTRYDKSDVHFGGAIHLAAVVYWFTFGV